MGAVASPISSPNPNSSVIASCSERCAATFSPSRQTNAAMNHSQPHW